MHDVKICLVSGNSLREKLIQWITGSKYNHVFIEFYSREWKSLQVIDITKRGVVQFPVSKINYSDSDIVKYSAKESMGVGLKSIQSLMGNENDWAGIVTVLFKLIMMKWFGGIIRRCWHSRGSLFCSEYVAMALLASDSENYVLDPLLSRPTDIMRYARLHLKRSPQLKKK